MIPALPEHEADRQAALRAFGIIGTGPEPFLDDLSQLAADICDASTAFISLVEEQRLWFTSSAGSYASALPREEGFCPQAILTPTEVMVVPDASLDPRFCDLSIVTQAQGVRFYAGVPLVTEEGLAIGTLCVMDPRPKQLEARQIHALRILGREVMIHFLLRRETQELQAFAVRNRTVMNVLTEGILIRDEGGRLRVFNAAAERLLGLDLKDRVGTRELGELNMVQENGEPLGECDLPVYSSLKTGIAKEGFIFGIKGPWGLRWVQTNSQPILIDGADAPVGIVSSFWDITQTKALQDRLEQEATHDALTGLPNRRAFEARLPRAIAAASRQGRALCLCLCDLDHFKQLNDRMGHPAGDAALQRFAQKLKEGLRGEDFPVRLGGDEFAILFEGSAAGQAAKSLDRIRIGFAFTPGEGLTPVTGTFGIADWASGMAAEELLKAADRALYQAKAQGRNRIQIAGAEHPGS